MNRQLYSRQYRLVLIEMNSQLYSRQYRLVLIEMNRQLYSRQYRLVLIEMYRQLYSRQYRLVLIEMNRQLHNQQYRVVRIEDGRYDYEVCCIDCACYLVLRDCRKRSLLLRGCDGVQYLSYCWGQCGQLWGWPDSADSPMSQFAHQIWQKALLPPGQRGLLPPDRAQYQMAAPVTLFTSRLAWVCRLIMFLCLGWSVQCQGHDLCRLGAQFTLWGPLGMKY